MGRLARTALTAAAVAGGVTVGYLAERRVLRSRLEAPPPPPGPPLGTIAGDRRELGGPDGMRVVVETYGPDDEARVGGQGGEVGPGGRGGADRGVARAGRGRPTLVLVHGWTMTGRIWHEQVAGLADRHRIVTYDQPGHGRSSPPGSGIYSIDLLGDTLRTVVDAATGPDTPVVLAGHSLGGMAVLNALRRHPELAARTAAVALLSTSSGSTSEGVKLGLGVHSLARVERPLRRLGQRLPRPVDRVARAAPTLAQSAASRFYTASSDLSFVLTRLVALAPDSDPRYVDFTEALVLESDLDMIRGLTASVLGVDEDAGLDCLPTPTVIVTGDRDHLVSPNLSRRMAARCPTAELVVLPGIGHMTLLEAHDEVNAVLEWLLTGPADAAGRAPTEAAGSRARSPSRPGTESLSEPVEVPAARRGAGTPGRRA